MKYHEACQHLADLAKAEADGKKIQICNDSVWCNCQYPVERNADNILLHPQRYRIAPAPTFRPWTEDEVPIGAVVKSKKESCEGNIRAIITGVGNSSVILYGEIRSFEALLERWTFADGTPCGTEVTA